MKFIYAGFGWIFGILFLLIGLAGLTSTFWFGMPFLTIALLLLPPVRKAVHAKTSWKLPPKVRVISIFVLIGASAFIASRDQAEDERVINQQVTAAKVEARALAKQEQLEYFAAHRDEIIAAYKDSLVTGNYQYILTNSRKFAEMKDEELGRICSVARTSQMEMQKEAKTKELLAELKSVPASQYQKNADLYTQLAKMHPDNAFYSQKISHYSEKIMEQKKAAAKIQRERAAQRNRDANIKQQFSSWNGAHRNLEAAIKAVMNDPDSFEHVESKYWDKGSYLIVQTKFRGKNAFGGKVLDSVTAKVSLTGQILEIIED